MSQHLSDKRLSGNLQCNHVSGTFKHSFWCRELAVGTTVELQDEGVSVSRSHPSCWSTAACPPANIIFGQFQRLCRELLCLVPLVAVTEVLPKLLRCEAKLFGQAIYSKQKSDR